MSAALPVPAQAAIPAGMPKRPVVASTIWLCMWGAIAVWAAHALGTAWPYVQLLPQWLLLLAMPGVTFRLFDLAAMRALGRQVGGWRRFLVRLCALVVGVFTAMLSCEELDAMSMARFEHAMGPLMTRLHAEREALCRPDAPGAVDVDLMAYLEASDALRAPAELHYDKQRFVLALPGRSMDIDGSSMFYDSRVRRWRKVHNDRLNQTGDLAALTAGLAQCRFALR